MALILAFRLCVADPADHRIGVELEMDADAWPEGADRELFLPVWTPGSYLVREYARHLEAFAAEDADTGAAIPFAKSAKNRYRLELPAGCRRLRVRYLVYAHELTVRTADVTDAHAYWNGACVFLWPVGVPDAEARIELRMPRGWTCESSILGDQQDEIAHLAASGLDQLIDAPVLAGTPTVLEFLACGKPHRLVLDGLDGVQPPTQLAADATRIVEQAAAIFGGELPYEEYGFLCLFADQGRGGLEHAESSTLLAPRTTFATPRHYQDFMGLLAHELFHVFNGKGVRPFELMEFDYERENHTSLLWVVEGWTAYFDDLLCLRAGVLSVTRYLEILAEGIGKLQRQPGRRLHTLAQASFDAWIKLYRPDENSRNSTQSYYASGSLAALCLDLQVRAASGASRGLDDVMRWLYQEHRGRGYREEDLRACLARAAGEDLGQLVDRLVHGPFDPDFEVFLGQAGLRLVACEREGAFLGLHLRDGGLIVASVQAGSPAAEAGISPGDEILALDALRVRKLDSLLKTLWRPGKSLKILLARRGRILERAVQPIPHPHVTYRIEEMGNASEAQVAVRHAWLGT